MKKMPPCPLEELKSAKKALLARMDAMAQVMPLLPDLSLERRWQELRVAYHSVCEAEMILEYGCRDTVIPPLSDR